MTDYVVSGGQTSSGLTISAGDTLTVLSGGTAISMTIDSGGIETISSGGADVSATVAGTQDVFGTTSNTIVENGGQVVTESGGVTTGSIVSSGGTATVFGMASGATVSAGGTLFLESGGTAVSTTLVDEFFSLTGAMLVVMSGGIASGTLLGDAAVETISSGGLDVGLTATNVGNQVIESGGVAIDAALGLGIQTVEAGGTAINTTLLTGNNIKGEPAYTGEQLVFGVAIGTDDGGVMIVESGGLEIGAAINTVDPLGPGAEDVYGTASGTMIDGGQQNVEAGGIAVGVTDLDGAQVVYGVASATTVVSEQLIAPGGLAIGVTISDGGSQTIDLGGVVSATTVYSGGLQTVAPFEQGINATVATASGTTLSGGSEIVSSGGMAIATTILSGGIETVASGGVSISSLISGSGALLDVQFFGKISGGVTFEGSGGLLEVDAGLNSPFTIYGLTASDSIDLRAITFGSGVSATLLAGNVLQVGSGGDAIDLQLDPAQNFAGDIFAVSPDSGGGTLVTEQNACFLCGTLILTPAGEVAVETLHIGDLVVTAAGAARPIKWVGRRSYAARFAWHQKHLLPVCIRAGALADGVPRRDLWLSPNHGLYLDGVLIEARDLVNGASIVQPDEFGTIEYFHIKVDSHDVLIANGAFAESYIDDNNRLLFHNAAEYRVLYPQESTRRERYCAPRLAEGDVVEGVRDRIARLAGLPAAVDPRSDPQRFVAGARLR